MLRIKSYKDLYIVLLIFYFLCLPLGALSLGAIGSSLRYIAILPVLVALVGSRKFYANTPFVLYGLYVLFAFFTTIWSISKSTSLSAAFSQVMLLALLASGTRFCYSSEEVGKLKMALVWSSRISALFLILFGNIVQGRLLLRSIIVENPNYFCTYLSFGIVYAMERLISKGNFKSKILPALEFLFLFTLIFLTGSRGGLLSASSGMLVFLLFGGKSANKRVMTKLVVCIMVIMAAMLVIEQLPEELSSRFSVDDVVESGGTGRVDIWRDILIAFSQANVFKEAFGHGIGTIKQALTYYDFPGVDSHNAFIGNLLTTGLIGVCLYAFAVFAFIRKSMSFESKFAFAVMFSIFVFTFGASASTLKPYFNIMLYIIISMNVKISDTEDLPLEAVEVAS